MKRLIEFVIFLFYKYYDKGSTKAIAYQSALIGTSLLAFMNLFALLIALKVDINALFPIIESSGRLIKYISSIILWLPFYLFFRFLFKEDVFVGKEVVKSKMNRGYFALVTYIIFSFIVLVVVIQKQQL